MIFTPKKEIETRTGKIQSHLKKKGYAGAIISHHTNLFYFSGTSQNGLLFIPCEGKPILMIRKSFERAQKESTIDHIVELHTYKNALQIICDFGYRDFSKIGFELDVIPYNTYLFFQKIFPDFTITDVSPLIKKIRIFKSDHEIDLIRKSCQNSDDVFKKVPSMVQEGITEVELAGLFEAQLRKGGMGGSTKIRSFNQDFLYGNIVSGSNGSIPTFFNGPVGGQGLTPANNPHGASWKKIERNESIYIDYACVKNGYTSDTARIFSIGLLPRDLIKAHEVALEIQNTLVRIIKTGISCKSIYEKAYVIAQKYGLLDNFMGFGKSRVSFIGHGVGLELDEIPVFGPKTETLMQSGITFALEPKFVFPHGAVGIENTFALTEQGIEKLNSAEEDIVYI
jgi:Xaa-Pro aminopeptidase